MSQEAKSSIVKGLMVHRLISILHDIILLISERYNYPCKNNAKS